MNQKSFCAELVIALPPRQSNDSVLHKNIEKFYAAKEIYDFLFPGFELELLHYLVFKDMMTPDQLLCYMADSLQSIFDEILETPSEDLLAPVGCSANDISLIDKISSGELCAYNVLDDFIESLEVFYRNIFIDLNFDLYSVSWETDEERGIIRYNIPEVYSPMSDTGDKPKSSPYLYRWLSRQRYRQVPRF